MTASNGDKAGVEQLAVEQIDRDAAADYLSEVGAATAQTIQGVREGAYHVGLSRAFARHRLAALRHQPARTDEVERIATVLRGEPWQLAEWRGFNPLGIASAILATLHPASAPETPAAGMGEVDKPTVERCIRILRGSLLAGHGPDALAQRDSDIAVLERELAGTASGERS